MQTISQSNILKDTKVLVRCDIDVPLENGKILETFRLDNLLETLQFIIEKGGKPILMGHIDSPKGKVDESLSTKQLVPYFNEKLGEGNYELLENLRFDPREEDLNEEYGKELASKADIYVNESFATCHRGHTSIVSIPKYLPHYAGFRLAKEIEVLQNVMKSPERPLALIIGGAKLESKKPVVSKFLDKADYIMLGGKLGADWNESIPNNLILPDDYAEEQKDIGPQTIQKFKDLLQNVKTVLWAGPLGQYENDIFFYGTKEICQEIAKLTQEKGIYSIIGGGDTITASRKAGTLNYYSFVSTGGGAMLEFLAGQNLPGIEALD